MTNRKIASRPRLDALTGLRFLAALHVMVYHEFRVNLCQWAGSFERHPHLAGVVNLSIAHAAACLIRGVVENGPASVGLFFVLSGFILAYTYLDRSGELNTSPRHFYINRISRIYPTYLLGFLLSDPFEVHRYSVAIAPDWGRMFSTGILNIALLQSFVPTFATSWNAPGWSLSVEMLFYLSFPLITVALMRNAGERKILNTAGGAVAMILALGVARLALGSGQIVVGWDDSIVERYFTFFPILRLPEFVLGMAVGRWFALWAGTAAKRGIESTSMLTLHRAQATGYFLAPLAMIAVPIVLSLPFSNSVIVLLRPVMLSILFAAIICGLAINSACRPAFFTRMLSCPPLILLGEASYAIYILHVPLGKILDLVPRGVWVLLSGSLYLPSAGTAQAIVYLSIVIGSAILVFRFLETPSRHWLRKHLEAITSRPETQPYGNVAGAALR